MVLGREIANAAVTLRASYLAAHVAMNERREEVVAFSYEDGAVGLWTRV